MIKDKKTTGSSATSDALCRANLERSNLLVDIITGNADPHDEEAMKLQEEYEATLLRILQRWLSVVNTGATENQKQKEERAHQLAQKLSNSFQDILNQLRTIGSQTANSRDVIKVCQQLNEKLDGIHSKIEPPLKEPFWKGFGFWSIATILLSYLSPWIFVIYLINR